MVWWIAQNALVSGLLAAVVAIVCRAARLSPAVKHALWLLVLVKLITPPLPWYQLPRSWDDRLASWTALPWQDGGEQVAPSRTEWSPAGSVLDRDILAEGAQRPVEIELAIGGDLVELSPAPDSAIDHGPANTTIVRGELPRAAVKDRDRTAIEPSWPSASWLLLVGWLVGTVSLAIVQVMRLVQLWRWVRQATPAPAWLDRLVRQAAARLGIRPPEMVVTPVLCSPLVCALGRPRLLWPAALSDQLSHDARQAVVLHELAHLRRRDHWVAWLELAAGIVWWFNPLYWYARHQLRENAELACDAWVVGLLPSGRRAYAQALIEVTEFVSFAAAASPAVAMGNVARRTLERRLTMILRERTSYRIPLVGTGLIGLSLLAVLPGWSRGQQLPTPKTAAPQDPFGADVSAADPNAEIPVDKLPDAETVVLGNTVLLVDKPADAVPATAANSVAADPDGDREARIRQIEANLSQLLGEVKALREGAAALNRQLETPRNVRVQAPQVGHRAVTAWAPGAQGAPSYRAHVLAHPPRLPGARDYEVETLTRARYKLPEATAKALASFIQEHVKSDVETKVEGDTLSVTASNEDQMRIAAFIELLREQVRTLGVPGQPKADHQSLPTIEEKKTSARGEFVPDLVVGSDARFPHDVPAVRRDTVSEPIDRLPVPTRRN